MPFPPTTTKKPSFASALAGAKPATDVPLEEETLDLEAAPLGEEPLEGEGDLGLDVVGEDFLAAVEAKDPAGVAAAFRAAFELLRSEP